MRSLDARLVGGAGDTGASTAFAFTTAIIGRVAGYPQWASELMLRIGQIVSVSSTWSDWTASWCW